MSSIPAPPFLIGIGGISGSGKSALARSLLTCLPARASLLSLDSYYNPLDHLSYQERCGCNFDHPAALDWTLAIEHLNALRAGRGVDEPVYLFETHTRAAHSRRVEAAPFILLEGILALHHEDVRAALDLRVFVETPPRLCFRRRLLRDTRERGRSPQSVRWQYRKTVWPMALEFVLSSRQWADLVLSGAQPLEQSGAMVLKAIARREG